MTRNFVVVSDIASAARALDDSVDLVITDYRAHGQSGVDFLRSLQRPELPAILMSGQITDQDELPDNVRAVLGKPFDLRRLRDALEVVING